MVNDQFLWVEKYRPSTIAECILPQEIKSTFQKFVDVGEIPNMLLTGDAGVGKTSVARALCEQLNADYIIINGSEESGIDVLRTKIKGFASIVSLSGKQKVVILDEADYLNPNSTQPALRGFIEEFSSSCRFIFTCNFKNKIIKPLHSRTMVVDFKISNQDKPKLASQFFSRVCNILDNEGITYDKEVLVPLVSRYFPDFRRTLNELQRYAVHKEINVGILSQFQSVEIKELVSALKEKDFKKMRQWVANNMDTDPQTIFRKLYDSISDLVKTTPQFILLLADYQYKSAFVADQEINLVACLTEIMATVEFK